MSQNLHLGIKKKIVSGLNITTTLQQPPIIQPSGSTPSTRHIQTFNFVKFQNLINLINLLEARIGHSNFINVDSYYM